MEKKRGTSPSPFIWSLSPRFSPTRSSIHHPAWWKYILCCRGRKRKRDDYSWALVLSLGDGITNSQANKKRVTTRVCRKEIVSSRFKQSIRNTFRIFPFNSLKLGKCRLHFLTCSPLPPMPSLKYFITVPATAWKNKFGFLLMQTLVLHFQYMFTVKENKSSSCLSERLNCVSKVFARMKALLH